VLESTTSVQINHPRFKPRYLDRLLELGNEGGTSFCTTACSRKRDRRGGAGARSRPHRALMAVYTITFGSGLFDRHKCSADARHSLPRCAPITGAHKLCAAMTNGERQRVFGVDNLAFENEITGEGLTNAARYVWILSSDDHVHGRAHRFRRAPCGHRDVRHEQVSSVHRD
jgi:hypothetical protein